MTHVRTAARYSQPLLVLFLLLLSVVPLHAQSSPDEEIAASQRRLEEIRRERSALREELTSIRTRVSDLSSELSNLERQVSVSAGLLEELGFQIDQRERQIDQNSRELSATRTLLAQRRSILQQRLRDIYKRGPLRTIEVLLAADSFSDLLNRYRYLFLVARYDRRLAEEVSQLEEQLVARESELRENLAQLESVRHDRSRELTELAGLQDQRRQALETIQTRERITTQRIAQLEEDEARLSALIETLERRRREAEAAARAGAAVATATLSPASRGTLAWPIEGPLVYRFGRSTQPNGTVVRWNGIGIAAPAGADVQAVAAGTVVMAGPFEGYGPTVVLSHGDGYYTLYLYLREVAVREGEEVTGGQIVGTVGGISTTAGPHIEFQIRVPGGEAIDPITWLRKP